MNVTLNLITEFEDIPNEVSHMLKFVQDELSSRRDEQPMFLQSWRKTR